MDLRRPLRPDFSLILAPIVVDAEPTREDGVVVARARGDVDPAGDTPDAPARPRDE